MHNCQFIYRICCFPDKNDKSYQKKLTTTQRVQNSSHNLATHTIHDERKMSTTNNYEIFMKLLTDFCYCCCSCLFRNFQCRNENCLKWNKWLRMAMDSQKRLHLFILSLHKIIVIENEIYDIVENQNLA